MTLGRKSPPQVALSLPVWYGERFVFLGELRGISFVNHPAPDQALRWTRRLSRTALKSDLSAVSQSSLSPASQGVNVWLSLAEQIPPVSGEIGMVVDPA